MSREQDSIRVQLNYPLEHVEQPILYHLVMDYGLVPNIRRANIDIRTGGFIFLELTGEKKALSDALAWLADQGITVNAIGLDGSEEWAI